jgi:hypothetical protein
MINNCCIQSATRALRARFLVAALPTSGNPAALGFVKVTSEYFASGLVRTMIR